VVKFAVDKQPGIGGNRGPKNLKHKAADDIELHASIILFGSPVGHAKAALLDLL
jgi:hypothetical protein